MSNELYGDQDLLEISKKGEEKAANALSKLSKKRISVETTDAKMVEESEALDSVDNIEGHAVIAYCNILTGFSGINLLTMERQSALDFVDLFNKRPKGTTVSMQEIDRSTIREALNILGNSYVTELANAVNKTVLLSVPRMVTKDGLESIVKELKVDPNKKAALFKTMLKVEETDYKVELFFFFLSDTEEE